MQRMTRPAAMMLAVFGVALLLPYTGSSALAETYSLPHPFCSVNAVEVTTGSGELADGMVSVSLGGGDAYAAGCDGYDGYVGLAVLGGSASGQLVAVALGDGDGTAATSTNSGIAVAPFGHAEGGNVNVGCTAATGVSTEWCLFFETYVSPSLQGGLDWIFTVSGFPSCDVANPGATHTDPLGNQWLCNPFYVSTDSILYGWTVMPVGDYGCPELKGVAGTSSEIYYTYPWIVNGGCPIPIRKGIYTATGFGWDHIVYRRDVDGQINHETTEYARNLWRAALGRSPAVKQNADGTRRFCHHVKYTTPNDVKRTMLVGVSDTNYEGDKGLKGILTAYWVSGHTNPCA